MSYVWHLLVHLIVVITAALQMPRYTRHKNIEASRPIEQHNAAKVLKRVRDDCRVSFFLDSVDSALQADASVIKEIRDDVRRKDKKCFGRLPSPRLPGGRTPTRPTSRFTRKSSTLD